MIIVGVTDLGRQRDSRNMRLNIYALKTVGAFALCRPLPPKKHDFKILSQMFINVYPNRVQKVYCTSRISAFFQSLSMFIIVFPILLTLFVSEERTRVLRRIGVVEYVKTR